MQPENSINLGFPFGHRPPPPVAINSPMRPISDDLRQKLKNPILVPVLAIPPTFDAVFFKNFLHEFCLQAQHRGRIRYYV